MSRKRFVKLVMSCGHGRNFANGYAAAGIATYGSYQSAWEKSYSLRCVKCGNDVMNKVTPLLMKIWGQISDTISKIGLEPFTKAIGTGLERDGG